MTGVTPAEIARQRELGWPDFHPEDYCHACGRPNVRSWSVDSDRWNAAVERRGTVLCPPCFVARWEQATGMRAHWRLVPEAIHWHE
jgi:hypothetical protein